MVRAKITSKGQITIPVAIRRRYQLEPGTHVDFLAEERGPRLLPVRRRRATDFYGVLPATKPYIGRDHIRDIVGRRLGEDLARKARRSAK